MRISEMLTAIATWLESPNNEAILLAEYDDDCLKVAAQACVEAAFILRSGAEEVDAIEPPEESNLTAEAIDELAEMATAFDASGDPNLKRTASVLDELLLTISAPADFINNYKQAESNKIDILKKKYEDPRIELEEKNKIADSKKAIDASAYNKEHRIMEHALSSRSCPEHAGVQLARVGEGMWQCELDKKVFNYEAGYTTDKGEKVPGGSVANQFDYNSENQSIFDSREERLSNIR